MSRIRPPFQPRGPRYPRHVRVEVSAIATDQTGTWRTTAISPDGESIYVWVPKFGVWAKDVAISPGHCLSLWSFIASAERVRVWRGIFTITVRV